MFKIHTKTKLLLIITALLLTAIFLTYKIQNTNMEKLKSPLLNPKKKNDVYKIQIIIPDTTNSRMLNSLTFQKQNNYFIFETAVGEYEVKDDIINNLLNALITKMEITKISSSKSSFLNYGFESNSFSTIRLEDQNNKLIKELYFGKKDTLGSNIYFKTNTTNIYKVKDIYSKFLTLTTHFWLDLQLYKDTFSKNALQGIIINSNIYPRNEKYKKEITDMEQALKIFTCIGIYYAPFPQSPDTKKITLSLGNNKTITAKYIKLENGDYVFADSRRKNTYIASNYAVSKLEEIIFKIKNKQ
ncbi:MAG: hypothetical protein CR988_04095 [Treponema sp.]|nr:MAG: hypothetical protein CR988_04095 [Treponema sp.]